MEKQKTNPFSVPADYFETLPAALERAHCKDGGGKGSGEKVGKLSCRTGCGSYAGSPGPGHLFHWSEC